jgi:hypothetical protein
MTPTSPSSMTVRVRAAAFFLSLAFLGCGSTGNGPGDRIPPPNPDLARRPDDRPNPERIVMLSPADGTARRLSDVRQDPHRPSLPPDYYGDVAWGLYKVCVDYDGAVFKMNTIKTAGGELDAAWSTAIRTWRFTPYAVQGQPTAFCYPLRIEMRVEGGRAYLR